MDKELIEATKKLKNKGNGNDFLEEHKFIANCLQIGFRIEDLKQMDYKDVAKIMIAMSLDEKDNTRGATQSDIDKLLR